MHQLNGIETRTESIAEAKEAAWENRFGERNEKSPLKELDCYNDLIAQVSMKRRATVPSEVTQDGSTAPSHNIASGKPHDETSLQAHTEHELDLDLAQQQDPSCASHSKEVE